MEILARAVLVVAGLVHLLPAVGLRGAPQLEKLYGIAIAQPELLLLMRHRALLFGLLGAGLIAAAFWPPLRTAMLLAGLVSTAGYCVLAFAEPALAAPLRRVVWIDVPIAAALLLLLLARLRTPIAY
ncbi:phosphopantetheine adenylyltransferase [Sinimarinibacterium flocculans]|uniref:phosphopantetheine adenylyltransferase n=1 Tax=Sinimarinibacterium flocculans TaxID=985250 RepID=UPI00351272A1